MNIEQTRSAIVAEALSWVRTPYHHHARIKGVGVDCAQILCAVYEECGVIEHVEPGNYAPQHHLHRDEELYIDWLQRCGAIEVQTPGLGDVALFHWGRTWSHAGIVVALEPEVSIVHSYIGHGVYCHRLTEAPLAGRMPRYWSKFA